MGKTVQMKESIQKNKMPELLRTLWDIHGQFGGISTGA
jgi:hypothetical protein